MAHIKLNIAKMMSNYHFLNKLCQQQNIEFIPVTKGILSSFEVCQALYDVGCRMVADAHWQNFASWPKPLPLKKMLLQVSPSQVEQALHYGDIFMVSVYLFLMLWCKSRSKPLIFFVAYRSGRGQGWNFTPRNRRFFTKGFAPCFCSRFCLYFWLC